MTTAAYDEDAIPAPLWIRRPAVLHVLAYAVAALVLLGQVVALLVRGPDLTTALAVGIAGAGVALSVRWPWAGLVVTSAATFAVTEVGQDPLSVWMMAVLVLFSFTFRGRPVAGTAVVAVCFLAAYMTVGGFRGGSFAGAAALFSALAGGATGAALRIYREHWLSLAERARQAVATRELESTRRVVEERLRIARDLHDVVGHQVAMLSVHLGVAEIGLPQDAQSSREALVAARTSARTVVDETQRILVLLRRGDDPAEEALLPTPGVGGLAGLVASYESIGLDVHATVDLAEDEVGPGVGVTVYRVVQEALTNAYRHGAGAVTLVVRHDAGRVHVEVTNPAGPVGPVGPVDHPSPGGGLGLVGMRERVESSGGRLRTGYDEGRFVVRAELGPVGVVLA